MQRIRLQDVRGQSGRSWHFERDYRGLATPTQLSIHLPGALQTAKPSDFACRGDVGSVEGRQVQEAAVSFRQAESGRTPAKDAGLDRSATPVESRVGQGSFRLHCEESVRLVWRFALLRR